MTALVDQDARSRIRSAHSASLFVEAGAGTGKTRALVDRVVELVATGHLELRNLAAITFTEAAASELRDRIRSGLEARAAGRGEPLPTADEQARGRAALEQVDEAALTTLHGFAFRILSEHPLEAGLPPGFELLDDITARIAFEQHWAAFVDELFADPALEPVLLTALLLGQRVDLLHGVARELHESYDRIRLAPAAPVVLPELDASPVVAALDAALDRRGVCCDDDDKLAQHLDGLVGLRDALAGARDRLDLLEWLDRGEPRKLSFRHGQKGNWDGQIEVVKRFLDEAQEARTALLDGQRRAVLEVLTTRAEAFVRAFADERRRTGRLEFHDLLVLAHDVLRRDAAVRRAVADRYPVVLLDEFQDTDPLQIQIAVLLTTRDADAGDKKWTDVEITPGALVVVGDPKQSIYRFRRADLGVYDDARHELGLEPQSLVQNFRSVPGVLAFVNHVFDALLVEIGGVQAAHVHLEAAREPLPGRAGGGASVVVFGDADDRPIAEIREQEAAEIAELVRRIKRDGWSVLDPVTGEIRRARYRDIALLIPSRTVLPDLEDALDRADVPVRVESQSLVFSTSEVRDLVSILGAIDDPTDEIAVVAALRSGGFGCSDVELVEFVQAGGRWDYRRAAPEALDPGHPVVAGLAALRELADRRWWQTVSETVEAVVRERHLLELATARRRPRDHWRRIRFLLDQARAWDDAGEAGLRAFIGWVQHQADERARVIESVAPEPDDDALRILTVHGAKGLEFPIVVLAGLNTRPPNRRSKVLWGPDGPEFTVGSRQSGSAVETDHYADLEATERAHDDAERLRLLYVAMTRARDHLVVSLHRKGTLACHAHAIATILDGAPCMTLDDLPGPDDPAAALEHDSDAHVRARRPVSPDPAARARWVAGRTAVLAAAARPASIAATAIAQAAAAGPDPGLAKDEPEDERPAWRRGRAGTAVGRAVHAVLQTVDLASGDGLDATARAQALAEGVPDREAEIRRLAQSALAAPVVREAVEGDWRTWREVPVATEVDGVLLEGFVDLLLERPDGDLVVVDWKTDQVPATADLDAALGRYAVQGAAYALALETVLARRVARCAFVFARAPGGALERDVPDLRGRIDAVRAGLAGAAAG